MLPSSECVYVLAMETGRAYTLPGNYLRRKHLSSDRQYGMGEFNMLLLGKM